MELVKIKQKFFEDKIKNMIEKKPEDNILMKT